MGVSYVPRIRASITNRSEFFYRFGEREKEACASFNFLDQFSSSPTSPERSGSDCPDTTTFLPKLWSDEEDDLTRLNLAEVAEKLEEKQKLLDESSEENSQLIVTVNRVEMEHAKNDNDAWHVKSTELLEAEEEHLIVELAETTSASIYPPAASDRISLSDSCAESFYGSDSEQSFRYPLEQNFRV